MTLRCMQALVRVQAQVLDQCKRQSSEGSRKSTFSKTNRLESRCLQDMSLSDRRSMSRDGSSIPENWDDRPHNIDELKAMLQNRKEAALRHERNLSQALPEQQMWRGGRNTSLCSENELGEKYQWLDSWMATKPWDGRGRTSTDQSDYVKTVEIYDTLQPYSYLAPNYRMSSAQHQQRPSYPLHRPGAAHQMYSPVTPSPSKTRPKVRSASPHCAREERSYHMAQTPSNGSDYSYDSGGRLHPHNKPKDTTHSTGTGCAMPNYMAATESAKSRIRSQSAPRHRPSTPERERKGAKKRLSYPVPVSDPYSYNAGNSYGNYGGHNLRSPSFESVTSGVHLAGFEQQSHYSSCYTESLPGLYNPQNYLLVHPVSNLKNQVEANIAVRQRCQVFKS
ncbi:protein IQ-DOMAIN 1-like isoform X1 [Olea europaea var. sylvestris]|uniref:protein IQ-DOMAIN 1-like isoform X1 n=1 Tax=Olea europaea var. sylvestris TaxID=158386 RepID=UPI000C1CEBD8|nr:protein IQ-DOMAIN 1-like isoform X1 [Olea europaea var. sylvestris]